MDTNTGESPGYQSQSQEPRNSPGEEVRGLWAPTGDEPMEQRMKGEIIILLRKQTLFYTIHYFEPNTKSGGL